MHTHSSETGESLTQLTQNCNIHTKFDNKTLKTLRPAWNCYERIFVSNVRSLLLPPTSTPPSILAWWPQSLHDQDNVVTEPCPSHACQTPLGMRTLLIRNVAGNTRAHPRSVIMFVMRSVYWHFDSSLQDTIYYEQGIWKVCGNCLDYVKVFFLLIL